MKQFLSILLLLIIVSCAGLKKNKQVTFPEVGWTLQMPTDANFLKHLQVDSLQSRANEKLARNTDIQAVFEKLLFICKIGELNYFGSTINRPDSGNFTNWLDSYTANKNTIIRAIVAQGAAIKIIDSSSTQETIDNVQFEKFYIKTFYETQQITLNTYWYYNMRKGYEFSINISYVDDKIGKQYFDVLRSSRFSK